MRTSRLLPFLLLAASLPAYAALKPGCQYFTQQDAAAVLGEAAKPGMDFNMPICNYSNVSGAISLQGGVRPEVPGMTPATIIDQQTKGLFMAHTDVKPVSGLGDKAILFGDSNGQRITLEVAAKGQLVMILLHASKSIDTPAHRDAMIQAAKLIISRL